VAFVLLVLAAIVAVVAIVPTVEGQMLVGGVLIILSLLARFDGKDLAL
jgi:hypothetical protein